MPVRPFVDPLPLRRRGPGGAPRFLPLPALPVMVVGMLIAGCVGPKIDELRRAEITGEAFGRQLAEEYKSLTLFEADEMFDWLSADHFASKGLRAADGEDVEVEALEDWDLPADKVAEMAEARSRLIDAMQAGARGKLPELAAHAQGRFDCWIEQQEENRQPGHISVCREKFYAALMQLEQAIEGEPGAAAAAPVAGDGKPAFLSVLFFAFDSVAISSEAAAALAQALEGAANLGEVDFAVIGHTDSAGPNAYNDQLSTRRAEAVRDLMITLGIAEDRIRVFARGELSPAVPTDRETILQANRRVEVLMVAPGELLISANKPKHDPVPPLTGLAPKVVTGSGQPSSARRRPGSRRRKRA